MCILLYIVYIIYAARRRRADGDAIKKIFKYNVEKTRRRISSLN